MYTLVLLRIKSLNLWRVYAGMIILGMGSLLGRYGFWIFLCLVAEKNEETRILNFSFIFLLVIVSLVEKMEDKKGNHMIFGVLILFYAWLSVHSGN